MVCGSVFAQDEVDFGRIGFAVTITKFVFGDEKIGLENNDEVVKE